jgi:predicted  nucleic acid-binding Zn-ribbon protein
MSVQEQWLLEYKFVLKKKRIKLISEVYRDPHRSNKLYAEHECLECGNKWEACAFNIKNSRIGCPACGIQTVALSRYNRHKESFDNRLKEKTKQIKRIEEYKGSREYINFKCVCGTVFKECPSGILSHPTCPNCKVRKKKSFSEDVKRKFQNLCRGRKYKILEYKGCTKVQLACNRGHVWKTHTSVIEKGSGCPTCAVRRSFTYRKVRIADKIFHVQGYEDIALFFMLNAKHINIQTICNGKTEIPKFTYFNGKPRTYYPDFQVNKRIIEVKSEWTAGLDNNKSFNVLKRKAHCVQEKGFMFTLLLFKVEGKRVYKATLPKDWVKFTRKEVINGIKWLDISDYLPIQCIDRWHTKLNKVTQ